MISEKMKPIFCWGGILFMFMAVILAITGAAMIPEKESQTDANGIKHGIEGMKLFGLAKVFALVSLGMILMCKM